MPWTNTPLTAHPLKGITVTFRPDVSPTPPDPSTVDTATVIAPGMTFQITEVFHHWNGITDLTVCYGRCLQTGISTHLSLREIGIL